MSIFRAFSARTLLPVKIDEIAGWIKESGAVDDINYFPIDRTPIGLRGLLDKYRLAEANRNRVVADIPFSLKLPPDEQRLVLAKELIHILDLGDNATDTVEKVSELISEVVIPPDILAALQKIGAGMLDHNGILMGLAVLVPLAAQQHLAKLHATDQIGVKQVAAVAEIPEIYAQFILTERWTAVLPKICA